MKLNYHCAGGRDLYAEKVACNCPNAKYKDDPVLAKLLPTYVRLSGYDDANFFDNVHKEALNGACECGRKFTYQWLRDGVVFEWEKCQEICGEIKK